jgi:hypothetical protein
MGTIFTIAGVVAAFLTLEVTASSLIRTALARIAPRRAGAAPRHGIMLAEFSGSLFFADLAALGASQVLNAGIALLLFAVAAVPLARIMILAVRQGKTDVARQRIGQALRQMLQTARYLPVKDLHALTALIRPAETAPAGQPPAAVTRPGGGGRMREVPHVLQDVALGPVPVPSAVAADLTVTGVIVHSTWGALTEREGTFEADDEDDLLQHGEETAAGLLELAGAYEAQAELAAARGLDPAYVAAMYDLADMIADAASGSVMVNRRYHEVYAAIRDHVDSGGTLMPDSDHWFGAQASRPAEGGQAA